AVQSSAATDAAHAAEASAPGWPEATGAAPASAARIPIGTPWRRYSTPRTRTATTVAAAQAGHVARRARPIGRARAGARPIDAAAGPTARRALDGSVGRPHSKQNWAWAGSRVRQ